MRRQFADDDDDDIGGDNDDDHCDDHNDYIVLKMPLIITRIQILDNKLKTPSETEVAAKQSGIGLDISGWGKI